MIDRLRGQVAGTAAMLTLDRFRARIAPALKDQADSEFPHPHHPHGVFRDKCSLDHPYVCLYFHVGDALLGYYDLLNGEDSTGFHARLILLEELADFNFGHCQVIGTAATGYMLATPSAADRRRRLQAATEERRLRKLDRK